MKNYICIITLILVSCKNDRTKINNNIESITFHYSFYSEKEDSVKKTDESYSLKFTKLKNNISKVIAKQKGGVNMLFYQKISNSTHGYSMNFDSFNFYPTIKYDGIENEVIFFPLINQHVFYKETKTYSNGKYKVQSFGEMISSHEEVITYYLEGVGLFSGYILEEQKYFILDSIEGNLKLDLKEITELFINDTTYFTWFNYSGPPPVPIPVTVE